MENKNRLLLAGLITGLTYQFHNVAFFCCGLAFGVCLLLNFRKLKLSYFYFVLPAVFALPFILFGGASFSAQLSFEFLATYVKNPFVYYPLNLGVPLVLVLASFLKRGHEALKITFILLVLIPNFVQFTPWSWDMYKFFMFAWVPVAVLSGVMLARARRIAVVALVLLSVMTSASVIIYNVGTDYSGASWSEYDAGLWIRENTPQNSVFLTYYMIHEPPTMIGGRVRVSSYVYWPYGHGVPLEEIWAREHQIDLAYNGTVMDLASVVREFNVSYVYVGLEELGKYPNCVAHFDSVDWLDRVYLNGNLRVYRVDLSEIVA
jgi:hypothetical protein